MIGTLTQFAAEPSTGGISALGLNWQSFLFQLISFVIVLLILRKFVYKKLVTTLEDRRLAVEKSIDQAAETAEKLKNAEKTVSGLIAEARKEADEVISVGHKEAAQIVEAAEQKATKRAEHIVKEAKSEMDVEVAKAREALKAETAQLVALAAERVLGEKIDAKKDSALITSALKQAKERANG